MKEFLDDILVIVDGESMPLSAVGPQCRKFGKALPWLMACERRFKMIVSAMAFDVLLAPIFDEYVNWVQTDPDLSICKDGWEKELRDLNYPNYEKLKTINKSLIVDVFLFYLTCPKMLEVLFPDDEPLGSNPQWEHRKFVLNSIDSMIISEESVEFSGRCYAYSDYTNVDHYNNFAKEQNLPPFQGSFNGQ